MYVRLMEPLLTQGTLKYTRHNFGPYAWVHNESIIDNNISKKIAQFSIPKLFGQEKCEVYL